MPKVPVTNTNYLERLLVATCLMAGILAVRPARAVSEVGYRLVAQGGLPVPGAGAGINFGGFSNPRINNAGQVVFLASLSGSGVNTSNNESIWSEGGGSLQLVAREGTAAPGIGAGVKFGQFLYRPDLSDTGQTAFYTNLSGTGVDATNDGSIWVGMGGSLSLLAREGTAAPGTGNGVNFASLGHPAINAAGEVAFGASLSGSGIDSTNNVGIWSNGGGSLHPVARSGWSAPGTADGVSFSSFAGDIAIDSAGRVGFRALVNGPNVDSTNDSGIWEVRDGSLILLAREGAMAPGIEAGVNFGDLSPVSANLIGAGQIAFRGGLVGAGVDATNDEGIWSQAGGGLHLVARDGSAAPGMEAGVYFSNFRYARLIPEFNDAGEAVFMAALWGDGVSSSNSHSVWSEGGGGLHLVARAGMDAPGTSPGVKFDDFDERGPPVISEAGKAAFFAHLTGGGVNSSNWHGIWAETDDGLKLVVRTGQELWQIVGPNRFISELDFANGSILILEQTGRGTVFNDQNQLAFQARFTNGWSGIFVSDFKFQPGDYNKNGEVDGSDYVLWRKTFGSTTDLRADGTFNEVIDEGDWVVWRQNFGELNEPGSGSAASLIPEPGSVALELIAIGILLFYSHPTMRSTGPRDPVRGNPATGADLLRNTASVVPKMIIP